jgi:hypothetical protein
MNVIKPLSPALFPLWRGEGEEIVMDASVGSGREVSEDQTVCQRSGQWVDDPGKAEVFFS